MKWALEEHVSCYNFEDNWPQKYIVIEFFYEILMYKCINVLFKLSTYIFLSV